VSRIDEAMRRLHGTADAVVPVGTPDQKAFSPAWAANGVEPQAGPPSRLVRPTDGTDSQIHLQLSMEWGERLAVGPNANMALVEPFRQLAGTLHHLQRTGGVRVIMVTSASPEDGKTHVAVNLAAVLANSYRANVLLVDADLRRPSITALPKVDGLGLGAALRSETDEKLALVHLMPTLTLLPAGPPIPNSIEALTSPRMQQILQEASERFDWVILDAPPVGPTTDPRLLAAFVDGVVFVVRAGKTQHADVQNGVDAIGRERLLGIVLNSTDDKPTTHYYDIPDASPR